MSKRETYIGIHLTLTQFPMGYTSVHLSNQSLKCNIWYQCDNNAIFNFIAYVELDQIHHFTSVLSFQHNT